LLLVIRQQSEFAEIVCRSVASHHAAACGGGTVPCAPGVVPRSKQHQEAVPVLSERREA
jgi:hypothetical protein